MWKMSMLGVLLVMAVGVFAGCGQQAEKAPAPASKPVAAAGTANEGWWCNEHGVPEGECALCSAKVAADFKKKGDWCKEHDRPESQCFICHPEHAEKFAARYEAKYGKKPPEREE